MAGALREMLAFFGVEVDDKQLDGAGKKMERLVGVAEKAAGLIGLAFGLREVGEFITGQVEAAATLAHTSDMLGIAVGDLQAFQYAAATAGISAEESTNAIRFLNKNIGEAATKGGDGAAAFSKLGVQLKDASGKIRPTNDIIADVADGFAKLPDPAVKTATAMGIFGRAGARMIPLLNKGSAGLAELSKEFEELGGGIDEEFIAAAEDAEHQMAKMDLASKGLKSTLASALLPTFVKVVGWVTQTVASLRAFSEHSYIVQTGLSTLGVVALGLVAIWGVLNFEILLVVLAIGLLVLIVDDVYTAFKGGRSVIGDFLDSIFGLGASSVMFNTLKTWVHETMIQFSLLGDELGAIGGAASDMTNEVLHALKIRTDAEYEAKKAENAKAADARHLHTNALDNEWDDTVAAAPKLFDTIDQNENAYAQSQPDIGPAENKLNWYHRSGASVANAGGQQYVPPPMGAEAGPYTQNVTQTANVVVNAPGGDPKAVSRAAASGTRQALSDTHEDDFAGSPTGGGH